MTTEHVERRIEAINERIDMAKKSNASTEELTEEKEYYEDIIYNANNIPEIPTFRKFIEEWKAKANALYVSEYEEYYSTLRRIKERQCELAKQGKKYVIAEDGRRAVAPVTRFGETSLEYVYTDEYATTKKEMKDNEERFPEYIKKLYPLSYKDDIKKNVEREAERKYINLINRVTKSGGKIIGAENLRVGDRGDIDGIIVCEKGRVKIQTITAGGWNIQCLHYRVLTNLLK